MVRETVEITGEVIQDEEAGVPVRYYHLERGKYDCVQSCQGDLVVICNALADYAYATTVHKSQGSEYPVVILPWITAFYGMLKRNIFYTAVTRAKAQVLIVGDKRAVAMAIHNTECDRRNTRLGERVIQEYNQLVEKKKALPEEGGYRQMVMNL